MLRRRLEIRKETSAEHKGFGQVGVDAAPTDVVHGDGGRLDVEAGDFGRRGHQDISDLGVMRDGAGESEHEVVDDRPISAGRKCWCETSDVQQSPCSTGKIKLNQPPE